MGKKSNKISRLEKNLMKVNAVILIHPAYDLRDLESHNKSPESYIGGLKEMNQIAIRVGKPIYAIPYTLANPKKLPPEIIEPWEILHPGMYGVNPNMGLQQISAKENVPLKELVIASGGMYETACMALWGQCCFRNYYGREVRDEYQDNLEILTKTIPIKGRSAKVIQSITRDKS